MPPWLVITVSALYLALLFAIARRGDEVARDRPLFPRGSVASAVLYTLTLGVHITAWSFYGGVGRAATHGFDYLATSIGAFLFLIFGQGALRRVIAISKARNITSVSDFLSARYGKSRSIAAFVTLASFVGLLPYLALQLKAVAFSFDILTRDGPSAPGTAGLSGATDFWAALALAGFTMTFGVRHIHASERHRGFVLAVAFDSLVKLAAFLAVALFIIYGLFDGFGALMSRAHDDADLGRVFSVGASRPDWWAKIAVAFLSFLCMPQFFHVAVVENDDPASGRPAAILYPAFVLVFSAFMTPVAIAGLLTYGGRGDPDTFLIALPMSAGAPAIGLVAFIGGLAAAAGMVMVSTAALSTMLCNDVVVPWLLRRPAASDAVDISAHLLTIRRALVIAVILCAFAMRRSIDDRASLVDMGVLSFVGAAQLAPAFFGGLYWRKANAAGGLAGMVLGLGVWFYTLLLPAMVKALGLSNEFIDNGPWKIAWLRPHALFGAEFLDPVTHTTLWSLTLNMCAFVILSLTRGGTQADNDSGFAFEPTAETSVADGFADAYADLVAVAAQFIGPEHAAKAFRGYAETRARLNASFGLGTGIDEDAVRFAEELIAGAIGAASARIVMAGALRQRRISRGSARAMIADASTALSEKHALLRAITENIQHGICALDTRLRLAAWNSRFSQLLDLPSELLKVGTPLSEIVAFNKTRGEYRDDELERLFINRDLANMTWPYVYERTRSDGTVLEATFNRMDIGGYVATYVDVTERYKAAQALRAANELLEQRVAERTTALEIAKMEAEKANAGKTRFLAAASHDLLQPLSAARLFLSAQHASLTTSSRKIIDTPKLAALAENALTALQSTESILAELVYMSSLDSRAIRPAMRDVDLDPILSQLGAEFSALAKVRGLSLRVVGTRLIARTDPALLRRALQNFLSNAVRYTPKGRILLGCRRRAHNIRIEVWDTGIGVPDDMREEIFVEFRRLKQQIPGVDNGVGLGLAVVDRIARLLDTRVTVCSRPGDGSMFAIEVPRANSRAFNMEAPAASVTPTEPSRSLLVLCLDNEQPVREGLKALLEQWSHRAVCAWNFDSAIEVLNGAVPDLVLVDYHLDSTNGLDVMTQLRCTWSREIPAVLITADRADDIHRAARDARCELLLKPIKPAALRRLLQHFSERRDGGEATND